MQEHSVIVINMYMELLLSMKNANNTTAWISNILVVEFSSIQLGSFIMLKVSLTYSYTKAFDSIVFILRAYFRVIK